MIPKRNLLRAIKKSIKQPGYAAGVFYKRLKSFITYRFYRGRSAYPETISLFLTYKCNLRCKMCGQWGLAGSSLGYSPEELKKQLDPADIEKVLDEVMSFKPNITLFGGEPLLYRDWPDVVRMVKKRKMRCNMITNGVLLKENAETIIDAGIDEIIFSLDGPRDVHDEIRGTAGTYDRAMAGFKKIQSLKKQKKLNTPLVNISTSIFETNYERLDEVLSSAEEMGASSITFHHLIFTSREIYCRHEKKMQDGFSCSAHDWAGFIRERLPNIVPDKLLQMLKKVKAMRTGIDISVYPNLTDDEVRRYYGLFDFLPESYKKRCMSPWMVAYVFPDGSVRPCQSINYAFGNLKETGFKQMWNCERATRYREGLKRDKYFPVCPRCTEFYRY